MSQHHADTELDKSTRRKPHLIAFFGRRNSTPSAGLPTKSSMRSEAWGLSLLLLFGCMIGVVLLVQIFRSR